MPATKKDTIYLEADDEITSVIEKVVTSKQKVVALVLPKRATVFQSAVNLKLLNKAAKDVKKNIVLITSDESINAIAAVSGVHIAKTLTSKPEIPKKTKKEDNETTITSEDLEKGAVGAVVVTSAATAVKASADEEPIKIDNTEKTAVEEGTVKKKSKKKLVKIPDFTDFRVRMALGIGLVVLLIFGWVLGFKILPKATVTMNTDTSRIDVNTDFTASVSTAESDFDTRQLSAEKVTFEKESTATVQATGKQDKGEKASGIITLTNCSTSAKNVGAGSSFSKDGKTFVSTESASLSPGFVPGGECKTDLLPPSYGAVVNVNVVAAEAGESYNIAEGSFTSSISGVTAYGSDMTGGTTNVVTVISAEDIKNATDQIAGSATAEATTELKKQLSEKQLFALDQTLKQDQGTVTTSAKEGDEVSEVTAKGTTTYTMLGVTQEDLSKILDLKLEEELEEDKNVRSNGFDSAVYTLLDSPSQDEQKLAIKTVATTGPEINEQLIKEEIKGKNRGEIENLLESKEGIRSVNVEFSPFWIFQTPNNLDKITIIVNETE